MKEYPSIDRGSKSIVKGKPVYAFDKLDGSHIRAEWSKQKKFWKFGTRRQLISKSCGEMWGEAPTLVKEKYERDLHDIFVKQRFTKVICHLEFYGKSSFAGNHADEPHDVMLFDIRVKGKGLILPKDFLKMTKGVETAKLLYHGNANEPFIEQVREGTLEGMTHEGVVCKLQEYKTPGVPIMFKVKSKAWYERLSKKCNGDEQLFNRLA